MALLVAAYIYKRGIKYLQLSNYRTRGLSESLNLSGGGVVDTPIAIAGIADLLRLFLRPWFPFGLP